MTGQPTRLKYLLQERHWQTYRTFQREYDRAAQDIDPQLVGSWPSRAQLERWKAGDLKTRPHPHHCRVLERMFPGWKAEQLFERCASADVALSMPNAGAPGTEEVNGIFGAVSSGLATPDATRDWGSLGRTTPEPGGADHLLAPLSQNGGNGVSDVAQDIGRKLLTLGKARRLAEEELRQLANLSGNVVELKLEVDIDIAEDGLSRISYRHDLLNLTNRPLARVARELWFEHTRGPLTISPLHDGDRHVAIQRLTTRSDTGNLAKFANQISPPIQPGESGVVRYVCEGGLFVEDHYWRQAVQRHTRHLTIKLRHRGAGELVASTAIEEHPDGSENSATEELVWDYDGADVVVTLTRDYLRPGQAVTLRWEVSHAPAR